MSGCVVLAGLLVSPAEASAQRDSQRKKLSLSAAIEEVRRGPFHAPDRANRSLDGTREQGVDPVNPFFRHGGARPVAGQEAEEDTQEAGDRGKNKFLFPLMTLGIAAGDLLGLLLFEETDSLIPVVLVSAPVTTLGLRLAGVSGGRAFAASSLGFAAGAGAGIATALALEDALYMAALIPGALAYAGVRLTVTWLIARRGVS